jgi:hypothetical protein
MIGSEAHNLEDWSANPGFLLHQLSLRVNVSSAPWKSFSRVRDAVIICDYL